MFPMELTESQRDELDAILAEKQQRANRDGAPQPLILEWAIRDTHEEIKAVALAIHEYARARGYNLVVGVRSDRIDLDGFRGAEGGGGHPNLWIHSQ